MESLYTSSSENLKKCVNVRNVVLSVIALLVGVPWLIILLWWQILPSVAWCCALVPSSLYVRSIACFSVPCIGCMRLRIVP